MSSYGVEIIDRLGAGSGLRDSANPLNHLIDDGVGGWFDWFVESSDFDNFFLDSATGGLLDCWGRDYSVPRKVDEGDDDYRKRLYYEVLGYLTVSYLLNVYELPLYVYVASFDAEDNDLTSDNPYIPGAKMSIASDDVQSVLDKKFVIGGELTWLTL